MDKKEVDELKWDQLRGISPDLPKEMTEELLGILDSLDNRKADKVNWEERELMNEASRRSGHILSIESEGEMLDSNGEVLDADGEVLDETAGSTNEKEKELMSGMGNILKDLEQLDG